MNNIKEFDTYILENNKEDKFSILYNGTPSTLKDIVDTTMTIEQNPIWHPEGNVYNHTRIVTNRLHNKYNDINLTLSGFLHDLGKAYTTVYDETKKSWTAHGHEDSSVNIINDYIDWIKKMGGNPDIIKYIVKNHMRIKFLDDFRLQEKINFINEKHFNLVLKFNTADYGGEKTNCKPLKDMSEIKNQIIEYNKKIKEDKKISSKFNGTLLMELYPELEGIFLGNAIKMFKDYIEKEHGDFRTFVLSNTKRTILSKFSKFYKGLK